MDPQEPNLQQRFPGRATTWRLRSGIFDLGPLPLLMGIVNVTPDSFSDGGQFQNPAAAIEHALRLADAGADILDIGGESTRPYSTPISAEEELDRVMPVVERLVDASPAVVSIDTSKAAVAEIALAAGAEILNDVTGFRDPAMIALALEFSVGVCAMHMQGTPQTMQDNPHYDDVVAEVLADLRARRDALVAAGIHRESICLDPGIGFGKTHEHNLTLLRHAARFHELECPVLVGHSRKGFLAKILGDKTTNRDPATLGASLALARQGIQILRVHNIPETHQALQLFEACGGLR